MSPVALEWGRVFIQMWLMKKFEDLRYLMNFWGIKKIKLQRDLGA